MDNENLAESAEKHPEAAQADHRRRTALNQRRRPLESIWREHVADDAPSVLDYVAAQGRGERWRTPLPGRLLP